MNNIENYKKLKKRRMNRCIIPAAGGIMPIITTLCRTIGSAKKYITVNQYFTTAKRCNVL